MRDRFVGKLTIGIFGGTFDPIHYGHLRVAEEAMESLGLNRILFIPAAQPPHKKARTVSPANHRLQMVQKALRGHPAFKLSDLECRRPGASYSIETLHTLREREGEDAAFFSLVGLDAFLEIDSWQSYEALFELSHWVVIQRPGAGRGGREALPRTLRKAFRYDRSHQAYVHSSGHKVYFRRFRLLEISGSDIRDLIRQGRSIRFLLPESVAQYIRRHDLYVGESNER